jgi:hypothetical protein
MAHVMTVKDRADYLTKVYVESPVAERRANLRNALLELDRQQQSRKWQHDDAPTPSLPVGMNHESR